ncbi:MAG: sigma-70 family RNA polymerase sigma factor [Planctomycetota bacterium]|nr:sigma-70 family RNA polymerase sigma factor [Planctomycetota bacterium]
MKDSDAVQRMTLEWTRAQPSVRRFIGSFLLDRNEAEDLLQEVALVVVAKFENWDSRRPFIGWSLGIARRVLLTHLRKKYQDRKVEFLDAIDQVAWSFEKLEPQAEQMKDALDGCLEQIRGQSKTILSLRYTDGRELKEIAHQLSMSSGNVGVMLHRIRETLRRCIDRKLKAEGLA